MTTCSPARLEANRRNSQRSTGPRTDQGKSISRSNALKHGFCAEVLNHPDDPSAPVPDPEASLAVWAASETTLLSARLTRLGWAEEKERHRLALRAKNHWNDDRRSQAEALGAGLHRNPPSVVDRLCQTPQGCDWLLQRWSLLARAADRDGDWTPAQVALALDLLSTPVAFRDGAEGESLGPDVDRLALARSHVAALTALRDGLADDDAYERETVLGDMMDAASPQLRRLRRYETSLFRRLRWCHQLAFGSTPAPARSRAARLPDLDASVPALPRPRPAPVAAVIPGQHVALSVGQAPEPPAPPLLVPVATTLPPPRRSRPDPVALRAKLRREGRRQDRDGDRDRLRA